MRILDPRPPLSFFPSEQLSSLLPGIFFSAQLILGALWKGSPIHQYGAARKGKTLVEFSPLGNESRVGLLLNLMSILVLFLSLMGPPPPLSLLSLQACADSAHNGTFRASSATLWRAPMTNSSTHEVCSVLVPLPCRIGLKMIPQWIISLSIHAEVCGGGGYSPLIAQHFLLVK